MPTTISRFLTRSLLSGFIIMFSFMPLATVSVAHADTCTPPDTSNQPGVHQPVGSDAAMYHYDCGSGMWVSDHYTYNPNTGATTPNDPIVYTYNPATGKYDTQAWIYNAPQGAYVLVGSSVAQPPAGATVIGAPAPASTGGSGINNTGDGSSNTINNNGNGGGTSSISNTGADSGNTINGSNNNNLSSTNNNQVTLDNVIAGQANSGNALVIGNTTAGDASTGNAQDVANIINLLQSSSNALGSGNVVTFVSNIDGDVNGDLLFDPATLSSVQPASLPNGNNNNLTINNSTDASINNNIDLTAQSGDATVAQNTTAGNATTGSAQAIANVVNLINSAIGAGQSFIGTININGNLNGDILIPPDLIDQLIATNVPTVTISNTGASSDNTINNNGGSNTTVNNTNNLGINNNVSANAQSGNANVSQNTTAGNATTGNAATSITAFNLTGSNVIGSNDILVFVNVVGKWVGMIVNAPAGATAAELGSGITSTGANSNNAINSNGTDNTTVNNNANEQINNNITTNAKSGDANVSQNTTAGNAKSGDAKSAVNLLNVENSSLSLSHWFGILFINVFGSWNGSFGMNTSAGDPLVSMPGSFNTTHGDTSQQTAAATGAPQVFRFVPKASGGSFSIAPTSTSGGSSTDNTSTGSTAGAVLAAQTIKAKSIAPTPVLQNQQGSFLRVAVIIGGFTALTIVGDALYTRRHPERA